MRTRREESADGGGRERGQALDARALLGVRREILLDLDGQLYRLRLTANGKLILTK